MPPRLRSVYMLSREQHLSVKEIADKLSVSEQTVKNQLTDILKRLRKEISRENFCYRIVLLNVWSCPIYDSLNK
ncbi:MAG: sigma factor-like helix-turn-helix DNA-binding protein [Butyricimonas faecihominis]